MESNSFREKDEDLWCERCAKRNVRKKLNLYQINYEESIFLCPSKKCGYPLEEEDLLKFIRKRKFSEIELSTSKKLSKKTKLIAKNALSSNIKGYGDDYVRSFSSSSNDFVDDLMDVSLDALDTPAESLNKNEKERKMSSIVNEISGAPTAFSEDMFWNEVFSPKVSNSSIAELISSISSDGSIEKISDMEDMATDVEKNYPLHRNCQQSDSNVSLQNNIDVLCSKDLLVPPNNSSDAAEISPLIPCTPEIPQESHVETQENISPMNGEIIARIDDEKVDPQINYPHPNSKSDQENHLDISQTVIISSEKPNSDILAEDSIIPCTTAVTKEQMVQIQQKSQSEECDGTVVAVILPKETITVSEKSFPLCTHQSDSDKNQQNNTHTHLDLSEQSDNIMLKSTEGEAISEATEAQDMETEQSSQIVPSLNRSNRVYPLWKNRDALCWLDATLCLLVHNRTLRNYIEHLNGNGDCHVKKVVRTYEQAVSLANNELPSTSENSSSSCETFSMLMNNIREDTFAFLQKTMQCTKGENDSPVFSFPLLLRENKAINELFLLDYQWELLCGQCGKKKTDRHKKTLPTFPSVAKDFSMLNASFLRPCFYCRAPEQRRFMRFDKLPNSFTIHFVQGLPTNKISQYDFTYKDIEYKITAVVQYLVKPATHFVTWVRSVEGNLWLCCDDLQNPNTAMYNDRLPALRSSEIHIVTWERQSGNYAPVENEKETVNQTDALIDELIDSLHNSPRSLISISSDESDQYYESTDSHVEAKEESIVASHDKSLSDVGISSSSEKVSSHSQKIHIENSSCSNSKVELPSEKIHDDLQSSSLEKDYVKCDNRTKLNISEADSGVGFCSLKPDDSLNITAPTENVNDFNKISELTSVTIPAEPTEKNEQQMYLSEIGIEQTVEVATSSLSADNQKEDSDIECLHVFKGNGRNLYNYSRKNGFKSCDKKIDSSNGHNVELTKPDIKAGLKRTKLADMKPDANAHHETEELTFQLGPCDPSLTTNTIESLYMSQQIDDQTIHSVPYFIKNKEIHKVNADVVNFSSNSQTVKPKKEAVDSALDSSPAAQDKEESVATETSVRDDSLTESLQTYKMEEMSNSEIVSNTVILPSIQTTGKFKPNAVIGDNTCVEICESVPLDAPIESGSVSYIVEVECPSTFGADPTSQIIVLNSEAVDLIESDELNNVYMQDTSHRKDENSQMLPPNTLHIVLQNENCDALPASTSNKSELKKRRSHRKKAVETENNNNGKSIPALKKLPSVLSGPAALLLERISKMSRVLPKKGSPKVPERKTKKKVNLLKETKSALDFSENVLKDAKLLSTLSKCNSDRRSALKRGRSK